MRKEIRSIDPLSAGKVGCLWGALLTVIFGCVVVFLPALIVPGLLASAMPQTEEAAAIVGSGFVFALGLYLGIIIVGAVTLAIRSAVGAFIYNIVANLVGGVSIDVKE